MITDTSDVKVRVDDKYIVQLTCAFRCNGIWPRSATHWPNTTIPWPNPTTALEVSRFPVVKPSTIFAAGDLCECHFCAHINRAVVNISGHLFEGDTHTYEDEECELQVKNEGFDLTSRETPCLPVQQQQNKAVNSMEGDAWFMSMHGAENILLS